MKNIFTLLIAFSLVVFGFTNHSGGIYKSNTGNIGFFSHTAVEDIKADNHKVKTAFDATSGKMQFSVAIKDFKFEKALMQEHFNEKYMESTKYPRSTFNGTIDNVSAIKFDTDGTYTSTVSGKLKIKDVTKQVSTTGTFVVKGGKVNAKATFNVNPEDYNVKIPRVVRDRISNNLKISVDVDYVHAH